LASDCVSYDAVHECFVSQLAISPTAKKLVFPTSRSEVRIVHGILHERECQKIINTIEELRLDPPPLFDKSVRNCRRRHTVDPGMSECLMPRIRPFVPEIVVMDGARWKLSRFTHHWRYVKYPVGGKFVPHWDGAKLLPWHEMTVFTVQIYLNDNFEGGSTRFYTDYEATRLPAHDIEYGKSQLRFDESMQPTHIVDAKTGSCLIFNHSGKSVLHDGEIVRSGAKYIMRGDILYSAIREDIPLLKSPSCVDWCEKTAEKRGTKNFIGQVWICWCSIDDAGAKLKSAVTPHTCADIRPPEDDNISAPDIPREEHIVRQIQNMKPIVILISGKRASGKDYIANLLQEELDQLKLSVCRAALGNVNKKICAEEMNLDYQRLLCDRAYKEKYRIPMVERHAERSKQNPSWCVDEIMNQCCHQSADVLVLSDIRMREDVDIFAQNSRCPPILLRVEASDEARKARGWDPHDVKDSLPTETDFDIFESWTAVIDNSNSSPSGKQEILEWIRNTVIPRVYIAAQTCNNAQ